MSKQPLPENSVPFTDILGYDGYMQTEGTVWQKRVYHAVTELAPQLSWFGRSLRPKTPFQIPSPRRW